MSQDFICIYLLKGFTAFLFVKIYLLIRECEHELGVGGEGDKQTRH